MTYWWTQWNRTKRLIIHHTKYTADFFFVLYYLFYSLFNFCFYFFFFFFILLLLLLLLLLSIYFENQWDSPNIWGGAVIFLERGKLERKNIYWCGRVKNDTHTDQRPTIYIFPPKCKPFYWKYKPVRFCIWILWKDKVCFNWSYNL